MKNLIPMTLATALSTPLALADDTQLLIDLDEQWGNSRQGEMERQLLTDSLIAVGPQGFAGKAALVAAAEREDLSSSPYRSDDYRVNFLKEDVAVMVHSVQGEDAHLSMHVWQKIDGQWKIAATATTPLNME